MAKLVKSVPGPTTAAAGLDFVLEEFKSGSDRVPHYFNTVQPGSEDKSGRRAPTTKITPLLRLTGMYGEFDEASIEKIDEEGKLYVDEKLIFRSSCYGVEAENAQLATELPVQPYAFPTVFDKKAAENYYKYNAESDADLIKNQPTNVSDQKDLLNWRRAVYERAKKLVWEYFPETTQFKYDFLAKAKGDTKVAFEDYMRNGWQPLDFLGKLDEKETDESKRVKPSHLLSVIVFECRVWRKKSTGKREADNFESKLRYEPHFPAVFDHFKRELLPFEPGRYNFSRTKCEPATPYPIQPSDYFYCTLTPCAKYLTKDNKWRLVFRPAYVPGRGMTGLMLFSKGKSSSTSVPTETKALENEELWAGKADEGGGGGGELLGFHD